MTATMPQGMDLRNCRLYRFYVEHPVSGEEVLGYIGETVRLPFERLMEHVDVQPWIDTVTRWERDPRVFAGKNAVLVAEAEAIRTEQPLYNVKKNEFNENRITPPEAIRQRRARDAALGAGRWVHPDDRTPGAVRPPRAQAPARRPLKPQQKRALAWSIGWLVSAVAGWIGLVWWWDFPEWWHPAAIASSTALTLTVWLWLGAPITRRQRRRAGRKLRGKRR